jgi:hypothetical protein
LDESRGIQNAGSGLLELGVDLQHPQTKDTPGFSDTQKSGLLELGIDNQYPQTRDTSNVSPSLTNVPPVPSVLPHPRTKDTLAKDVNRINTRTISREYLIHLLDELIDGLCRGAPDIANSPSVTLVSHVYSSYSSIIPRLGYRVQYAPSLSTSKYRFLNLIHPSGPQVMEQALYFIRSVMECLLDYDTDKFICMCKADNYSSFISFFNKVLSWPLDDFIKNAKFFTAYPLARFLRNPVPANPPKSYGYNGSVGSALLFRGSIKRYLKNRILSSNRKHVNLFNTLLLGVKRGCATVPTSFETKALANHAAALSKSSTVSKKYISFIKYFERFWKNIRSLPQYLHDPSTSASYQYLKSQGGAYGEVFTGLVGDLNKYLPYSYLESMTEVRPGTVKSQRTYLPFRKYSELVYELPPEKPSVKVHPIVEPLKVRLITKGPAYRMWYSKQLQQGMWEYLQTIPAFALTGHPLSHYDLEDLERRHGVVFGSDKSMDKWVSGDYSAATDNLKIQYTKLSMETVLSKLNLDEQSLDHLRSVIYEQSLEYPHRFSEDLRKVLTGTDLEKSFNDKGDLVVEQRNGQLMGSILSFPILCSCNLVSYWATLEEYLGRTVELKDLPVLVNGDDILFRTNDAFYSMWRENISEIGFELSVGKNYVHSNYLMVNSEPYWKDNHSLVKLSYYNIGLLTGRSKLRSGSGTVPLWDYYNKVIGGASNKLRAHMRFLHLNQEVIERITFKGLYNLFIDPHYGGLGFQCHPDVRPHVKFTTFQKQFGRYLLNKLRKYTGDKPPVPVITLIQDKKEKRHVVSKYHYGSYVLRPYRNIGTFDNPEYRLVIDQMSERIVRDNSVRKPIMSELPNIGELVPVTKKGVDTYEFKLSKDLSVRQPRSSLLRDFRENKPKRLSVRPLLYTPKVLIERLVSDIMP